MKTKSVKMVNDRTVSLDGFSQTVLRAGVVPPPMNIFLADSLIASGDAVPVKVTTTVEEEAVSPKEPSPSTSEDDGEIKSGTVSKVQIGVDITKTPETPPKTPAKKGRGKGRSFSTDDANKD